MSYTQLRKQCAADRAWIKRKATVAFRILTHAEWYLMSEAISSDNKWPGVGNDPLPYQILLDCKRQISLDALLPTPVPSNWHRAVQRAEVRRTSERLVQR